MLVLVSSTPCMTAQKISPICWAWAVPRVHHAMAPKASRRERCLRSGRPPRDESQKQRVRLLPSSTASSPPPRLRRRILSPNEEMERALAVKPPGAPEAKLEALVTSRWGKEMSEFHDRLTARGTVTGEPDEGDSSDEEPQPPRATGSSTTTRAPSLRAAQRLRRLQESDRDDLCFLSYLENSALAAPQQGSTAPQGVNGGSGPWNGRCQSSRQKT